MRAAASVVWLVLVVVGTIAALAWRPAPAPGAMAVAALPQNTLLLPSAFFPEAWSWQYVLLDGGLPAKARVDPAALSPLPLLPPIPSDRLLAEVPASWADVAAGLNAGRLARLCRDAAELASLPVVAVRCDKAEPSKACSAVLSVPLSPPALLQELAKPDKLHASNAC